MTTIEKLTKFVNQRPGLDFADYGNVSLYRKEMAEITRDRNDYFELLALAHSRVDNLNEVLTEKLSNSENRLSLSKEGNIIYCTGQYFPTEYRPAANAALKYIIWRSYANEMDSNNNPVYTDGIAIRKAIKRRVSRRVYRLYFN